MKKNYLSIALCSLLLSSSTLLAEDKTDTTELDSVTVTEKTSSNYLSNEKPTVTRNNLKIEDTAKSIQVFNEEFIEDFQALNLNSIVVMSSNTIFQGDNHGRENIFAIRGFSDVPVLRDGFSFEHASPYPEVYNIERVEVLKGPDSLEYGESSPGGLINIVKKKPDSKETHGEIELELTSNTSYSPKLDIGGSLNDDGSLRYRLVSVYKRDEGIKDYNFDAEETFIAPSIAWDINDNYTLTVMAEYLDRTEQNDFGTFVNSNGDLITSVETVTSNPDEKRYVKQKIVGFDLDGTFETWKSSLRYRYADSEYDVPGTNMPFFYLSSTNSLYQVYSTQYWKSKEHGLEYTLNKEIGKHNITLGMDFKRLKYRAIGNVDLAQYYAYYYYINGLSSDLSSLYQLDLSNISYDSLTSSSDHTLYQYLDTDQEINKYGVFIQDTIDITDKLILNLGVRQARFNEQGSESDDATLPQFGLTYKLSPKTNIYSSYSESFEYQTDTDSNGDLLDPEKGKGYEIGIKQKLFKDNFNLTAALFKIDKENVSMEDPSNSLYSVASGKQTSKGIELDLAGKVTKNWSLIASYGFTDSEDKSDNPGKQLVGVPKHTANIFTTYNLASFNLPSAFVGGGVKYLGERYANSTNTIKLDSNLIYTATAGYKIKNWKFNLSLINITDEEYVETNRSTRVTIGTPRTYVATIGYSF